MNIAATQVSDRQPVIVVLTGGLVAEPSRAVRVYVPAPTTRLAGAQPGSEVRPFQGMWTVIVWPRRIVTTCTERRRAQSWLFQSRLGPAYTVASIAPAPTSRRHATRPVLRTETMISSGPDAG